MMSHLRKFCVLFVLGLLATGPLRAQERVLVVLDTNMPEALVYADSLRLGLARQGTFRVPAGAATLRLVPASGTAWSIRPIRQPLAAQPGDTLDVRLHFPYHYQVESVPFGATVRLEDGQEILGETPLLYRSEQPLNRRLVVEEEGYLPEEIEPGRDLWNRYVLTLEPVAPEAQRSAEVDWSPPKKRRRWIDVSAGALALGAGVLAVHYKFKADRRDDRYRETGDPELRESVEFYDRRAAVALGAMQVGVGVLAVRFVLR